MVSINDKNGTRICSGTKNDLTTLVTRGPALRLMVGPQNAAEQTYTVDLDNVSWIAIDTAATKNVVAEDFDSLTTGIKAVSTAQNAPAVIGNLANYSASSLFIPTVKEEKESGNKYMEIPTGGANGFILYPANFVSSQYWTMTFDFKLSGSVDASSKYLAIYALPQNTSTSNQKTAIWRSGGLTIGSTAAYDADTWWTFKMIRNGTSMAWMAWERDAGDYNDAATTKRTVSWSGSIGGAVDTVPAIRLMGGGTTDGVISIDNMVAESTINTVTVVGGQSSNTVTQDGTYAVRFVATLNDFKATDTIQLRIKATYTDTSIDAEVTKYFTYTATEVYDYIIGNDHGVTEVYSAAELGGEKLIALGVHGIPTSAGTVKFEVTTVGVQKWAGNGVDSSTANRVVTYTANTVNPNVVDCYSIVEGNTVKLVDELPA